MKVLVTGAAGFIGFHVVSKLLNAGHFVVGFDNLNKYYSTQLKYDRLAQTGILKHKVLNNVEVQSETYSNYFFIKMDLCQKEAVVQLFETHKFDIVIHLAAQAGVRYSIQNPEIYLKSNVDGFLNILEACRQNPVKHLVYASSSSVYGNHKKVPFSVKHKVDTPISLYAATKKSNELMAHTYSHLFKIPTTGLRFFTVYGPWGRPDMAPSLFTDAIINNKPIKIFNNGKMKRDFTYVDDIVKGIIGISKHPPVAKNKKPPYVLHNVGNSKPIKLMAFIKALENNLNIKAKKMFLPMQPGDVKRTFANVTSLKKAIGYKPTTSLNDGVKAFVDWYVDYFAEKNTKNLEKEIQEN
ncbi:NAD-dependent epimerase [Tamlana sp. 62-3]|uniref:NAD-dependent epimerase n=1 Tax=Neotamlana sargassicola TaxID=2883125 RepID=A0A9X1I6X6_9FLAO|nr:NAD-dependent epimerase [Tamlana sargassicola]MCB4807489.1 NAD-dependent epimerase [Tamlana sargassicola]